jgi:hypothetical protein
MQVHKYEICACDLHKQFLNGIRCFRLLLSKSRCATSKTQFAFQNICYCWITAALAHPFAAAKKSQAGKIRTLFLQKGITTLIQSFIYFKIQQIQVQVI